MPLETGTEADAATRGPPQLGAVAPDSSLESLSSPYPIIGNRRSHSYHGPDCRNYSQIAPRSRVEFNRAAEAEAAGYRVAENYP